MSKKGKGRKVDLTQFLAGQVLERDTLPKGPSGQPREDRRDRHQGNRFGDDSFGDRGGGFGGEEAGFGASEASEWRRGGPGDSAPAAGGGFRGGRGGFDDGPRGGGGFEDGPRGGGDDREAMFSAADNDDQWRRGPPPGRAAGATTGGDDRPNFSSAADEDDQWRRGAPPARAGGADAPPVVAADGDDDWRGSKIVRSAPVPTPVADEEDDWRGKRVVPQAAAAPAPNPLDQDDWRKNSAPVQAAGATAAAPVPNPLDDSDWRRNTVAPAAPVAPTEESADSEAGWRKAAPPAVKQEDPIEDSGRPRLVLKSKKAPKAEEPSVEAAEAPKDAAPEAEKTEPKEDAKSDAPSSSTVENGDEAEKKDKWDSIFQKKKTEERPARMFGDQERDQERERVFKSNSTRAEPRERPGSHAFGTGRRNLDDEQGAGPAQSRMFPSRGGPREDNVPRNFPGSQSRGQPAAPRVFPGSQPRDRDQIREREMDRERASMAFGGGRQRDEQREQRDMDRERASMAFGGGRRDRERDGDRRDDSGYGERFGGASRRGPARDEFSGFNNTQSAAELQKLANVGDWGSDDENDNASKQKKETKKLTKEEVEFKSVGVVKSYLLVEDKRVTVNDLKKLCVSDFASVVVEKIFSALVEEGSVKACKLVVSLLSELLVKKIISAQDLTKAADEVASTLSGDDASESSLDTMKTCGGLMKEADALKDIELSSTAASVFFPGEKTSEEQNSINEVDAAKASEMASSSKRGADLVAMLDDSSTNPVFGVRVLKKLLTDKKQLVKDDEECSWLNKDQYGQLFEKLLFKEDPAGDELEAQVDALFAIQDAFNEVGFPRAANGQALIEKTFMKLYNDDIIAPEAISAWKEDLSERPGKMDAIVQLSQFVNWLEADDESEEDDE